MIPVYEMNEQLVTVLLENGPGNTDIHAFIMQQPNEGPPHIRVCYQTLDAEGEETDAGIETDEYPMVPDASDLANGHTPATLAEEFMRGYGRPEPSASFFHPNIWYETSERDDLRYGQYFRRSFHLKGFTPDEERAVYDAIKKH